MGSVALLSREGEVVIAKKIEAAENKILEKSYLLVLDAPLSPTAKRFINNEMRMKSWIKGFDDDEASNNEEAHEQKVRLATESFLKIHENYLAQERRTSSPKAKEKLAELHNEMFAALKELNINRKLLITSIESFAEFVNAYRESNQDMKYYAKRLSTKVDTLKAHIETTPDTPFKGTKDSEWARVVQLHNCFRHY